MQRTGSLQFNYIGLQRPSRAIQKASISDAVDQHVCTDEVHSAMSVPFVVDYSRSTTKFGSGRLGLVARVFTLLFDIF